MESIRIGIVGLGGICRTRHVPGFLAVDGVKIVAVANRTRESGERAAREFNIPVVCDSWQDLAIRDDVDLVLVGTWPYLHRPVTLAALDAGKHVFCQARMAMDYAEAREMYERARQSDRVTGLCPVPIGMSVDATIRRFIRDGDLGRIRLVRVQSFTNAFAEPDAPMSWRKDHRLSGLNMHTLGMYIEVVHRWFGWTKCVNGALMQTFTSERTDETGQIVDVKIPDQVLFNTSMESGFPVQYVISAAVHQGFDAIEIYGSKATLRYDVRSDVLFGAKAGESMGKVAIRPECHYDVEHWSVERDFIAAIREGKEYHPDFEDGMRYMQVIQAVYDTAANTDPCEVTLT